MVFMNLLCELYSIIIVSYSYQITWEPFIYNLLYYQINVITMNESI